MSASDTIAGYVNIILSSQGGICPSVSDTMRVEILKAPMVTAGHDTSVCNNIAIPLHGNVTGYTSTGQWYSTGTGTFFPNNTALAGQYIPSNFDLASGYVYLILESTNNKGCAPRKDTVKFSFIPAPHSNFTYSVACLNAPVIFTDLSSTTTGSITSYYWDFGDAGNTISQNATHTYTMANTYTVTHIISSNNGCIDSSQKLVQVNPLPIPNFTFNKACERSLTLFFDSSYVNPGTIVGWHWNFADGQFDTIKNPSHVYATPAIFNVVLTVKSSDGCVNSITKPVDIKPRPHADFAMTNNPTVANEVVYFSDFSTPASNLSGWFWNFGDNTLANVENPTHAYIDQGDFTVTLIVTSKEGCTDTARKDISVVLLPQVPTAFSPNNDGNNDVLYVKGGPFKKMSFKVYNNWGEMLFESNDATIGWDGKYKGEDQPVSVYVWVLEVEIYNNRVVKKSGDVTLLR